GQQVKLNPADVKEKYIEGVVKYRKALRMRCHSYRIDYIEADIRQGFRQVLLPYLVKRVKMK
ncbi:MAG: DUF58 domain-containing protein, partial [Bacteroidota bacterium]|nr:DUF58 domain-containing protein [Bacteroidota bacterium]